MVPEPGWMNVREKLRGFHEMWTHWELNPAPPASRISMLSGCDNQLHHVPMQKGAWKVYVSDEHLNLSLSRSFGLHESHERRKCRPRSRDITTMVVYNDEGTIEDWGRS